MMRMRWTGRGPCPPAACLCGRRSPASAAPLATSSAGRTTTIGCGTATFAREVLQRSEELKRDWNRQVDRAAEEGIHVIYTDGYVHLHKELDTIAGDMLLDRGVKSEISAVLAQLGKAMSNRKYFDNWPKLMAGQMGRRETLEAKAAERAWRFPTMGITTHGGT